MKLSTFVLAICLLMTACSQNTNTQEKNVQKASITTTSAKKLRHVVLFKFKEETTVADIKKVEAAFSALPSKIPEIKSYEWGTDNSPEGLAKGFTHCFFLTFDSEEGRAVYLPHPDHKAFGAVLTPHLEDVLVLDYWAD